MIGECYELGRGVPVNMAEAVRWCVFDNITIIGPALLGHYALCACYQNFNELCFDAIVLGTDVALLPE
jgi:TPR repeat protein